MFKKKPKPELVICKNCIHISDEKQKLDAGGEEYCCCLPAHLKTSMDYITGVETKLRFACFVWNKEGKCIKFERAKNEILEA